MNTVHDDLLSVPENFDFVLAAIRGGEKTDNLFERLIRSMARFGALPNRTRMSPCSANCSRASSSIAAAASATMMSMSIAGVNFVRMPVFVASGHIELQS
jgi:hypothetical protein